MANKQKYEVMSQFFIGKKRYKKGDTVELADHVARSLGSDVQPYSESSTNKTKKSNEGKK